MAGRKQKSDLEFGSDSFLDIVCNVVGILVILIVIAGVKVSRAPVAMPRSVASIPEPAPQPAELMATAVVEALPAPAPLPEAPPPEVPAPLPPRLPQPPAELVARASQIKSQLTTLRADGAQLRAEHRRLADERRAVETELQAIEASVAESTEALVDEEAKLSTATRPVDEARRQLEALRALLLAEEQEPPKTQPLEHRITPIGQVVNGQELHFRLSGNRVAPVPVERLAEQLKREVDRQRDRLLQLGRYEGTVGPVDGFTMRYLIERQEMSLADELRYGQRVIRMGVSQWVIEPEPELRGETADEALSRTSRFFRTLQSAGPVSSLTFWVYPDSFELHRRLQEFAHVSGYNVAARPLPDGVPITGSPQGSKSVAQ